MACVTVVVEHTGRSGAAGGLWPLKEGQSCFCHPLPVTHLQASVPLRDTTHGVVRCADLTRPTHSAGAGHGAGGPAARAGWCAPGFPQIRLSPLPRDEELRVCRLNTQQRAKPAATLF